MVDMALKGRLRVKMAEFIIENIALVGCPAIEL